MKKTLLALAALAALGMSTTASAEFLDFTINEASVPGITADADTTFVADKITGGYSEQLALFGDNTFLSTAYVNFGTITALEGSVNISPTYLDSRGGFGLYAIFNSAGTYAGNVFTGSTGSFDLYIDADSDTGLNFSFSGLTPITTSTNTTDDYKIGFSTNFVTGSGIAGGNFKFDFTDFELTTAGADFFIAPEEFHKNVRLTGDFDELPGAFTPLLVGDQLVGQSFITTGDVSAVFVVPEPGSLALLGLGLAGLGFAQRRRNLAK